MTNPTNLTAYLNTLNTNNPFYVAKATLLSTNPSTIIHSDATTAPSTFSRYQVWLVATCGYQTLFHYVGIDALGHLVGGLLPASASPVTLAVAA